MTVTTRTASISLDFRDDTEEDLFPTRLSLPPLGNASGSTSRKRQGPSGFQSEFTSTTTQQALLACASKRGHDRRPIVLPAHEIPSETMSLSTISDGTLEPSLACHLERSLACQMMKSRSELVVEPICASTDLGGTTPDLNMELIMQDLEELELDDIDYQEKFDEIVERFPEFKGCHLNYGDSHLTVEENDEPWIIPGTREILPWLDSLDANPLSQSPSPFPRQSEPLGPWLFFQEKESPNYQISLREQARSILSQAQLDPCLIRHAAGEDVSSTKPFHLINVDEDSPCDRLLSFETETLGHGSSHSTNIEVSGENDARSSSSEYMYGSIESDWFSEETVSNIGAFAAEQLFGPDFEDSLSWSRLRETVQSFISELVLLKIAGSEPTSLQSGTYSNGTEGHSNISSHDNSSHGVSSKRKLTESGDSGRWERAGENEDDGDSDNERGNGHGRRVENDDTILTQRLEFMCPFRLKDPVRFNVRDWYDCSTKVYVCNNSANSKRNDLNELRRHIKQKHSGPGILSQPYCSTCKEEFPNSTALDEHAKGRSCPYRELPSSNDPFDGISPAAERLLRSKQGRQGDGPLSQYRQICRIVFGDQTEIPTPGYLPVIEHFELHGQYLESLPRLREALLEKFGFRIGDLDALLDSLHIHAVDVFGQCRERAMTAKITRKRRKTNPRKPGAKTDGHGGSSPQTLPRQNDPTTNQTSTGPGDSGQSSRTTAPPSTELLSPNLVQRLPLPTDASHHSTFRQIESACNSCQNCLSNSVAPIRPRYQSILDESIHLKSGIDASRDRKSLHCLPSALVELEQGLGASSNCVFPIYSTLRMPMAMGDFTLGTTISKADLIDTASPSVVLPTGTWEPPQRLLQADPWINDLVTASIVRPTEQCSTMSVNSQLSQEMIDGFEGDLTQYI